MTTFPTSNTSITFPQSALYPPGVSSPTLITSTQRSLFSNIMENGQSSLFQNPMTNAINSLTGNISALESTINNSTCLNYTPEQKASAVASLTGTGGLMEQLQAFTLHTNTLAGVIAGSTNNPTPGLERILSVGRSLQGLYNTIQSASGCLELLSNMSGLFANEEINGYANELANMIASINNCLGDLTEIVTRVLEIKNLIQNIINSDINFFESALETLRRAALASLLEYMYNDPCGRFMLDNQIGSTVLRSIFR